MADVIGVDWASRHVEVRVVGATESSFLDYEHLVIALGSVTNLPPEDQIPGARTHCFQIKNLTDAVALRDRGIVLLEMANACADAERRQALLRFVIVGGSFTGVELAGEYEAFLRGAAKRYRHVRPSDIRVTLVEVQDRVLGALDESLSDFAAKHLRKRGLDLRLRMSVRSVASDHVVLADGARLPTHTVIWCAGIAPNPLVKSLKVPLDQRGYIECERDLRIKGFENVWAIGDLAINLNDDGSVQPATAQHATRQGAFVARNIASVLAGKSTQPCHIKSQGMLAAIGCRTAVANVFGIPIAGFMAWWMWRTVYLMKMPGLGRKVRVALDWTIDLFFKRDYVQLGVHRLPSVEKHDADEAARSMMEHKAPPTASRASAGKER
jgi:NADH dehydrogenase